MTLPSPHPSRSKAIAGPLALLVAGVGLSALAHTQPSFAGDRIGPGLFAQWLSAGVIGMSLLWLAVAAASARRGDRAAQALGRLPLLPGVALLASVAVFIALMPSAGLVVAAAGAAALAAVGAGDRTPGAVALSASIGGGLALAVGLLFLPPTTRLVPWSPF